ncbi:hypothetical protein LCGC14_2615300, partial [marine sediment metagenome]
MGIEEIGENPYKKQEEEPPPPVGVTGKPPIGKPPIRSPIRPTGQIPKEERTFGFGRDLGRPRIGLPPRGSVATLPQDEVTEDEFTRGRRTLPIHFDEPFPDVPESGFTLGEGLTLKRSGEIFSDDFKFASVGKLDPETREFIPAPWVEPAGVLSDILKNAPWVKSGKAQFAMERFPELVVPERGEKLVTLPPEYDGLPEEVRETARLQLQFRETEKTRGAKVEGLTEEYEALPWHQQLKYELPFWTLLAALPAARVIRSALAPFTQAGRPIAQRVAAEAGRVALAPAVAFETAIATGLKYGVGLPIKLAGKGIAVTTRKAFETALDAGLDKWLVRQGIRAENAPRIIEVFMRANKAWLYRTAQENLKKRMAQKMGTARATQA